MTRLRPPTGFDVGDRRGKAVRVADHLHVAAMSAVFAGEPQVVAGVGVLRSAAISGNQGAVGSDIPMFTDGAAPTAAPPVYRELQTP